MLIEPPGAGVKGGAGILPAEPKGGAGILPASLEQPADTSLGRVAVLDTTLAVLRTQLRGRLGLAGPLILTGHQAEFFHAGVFAKTIAAHALANRLGGTPAFLTVDSDLPKTTQLAIPQSTSGGLRRIDVAIPGCDPQCPFEWQPPTPREHWLQFFARVGAMYEFHDQSLLPTFARAWIETDNPASSYCDALAAAQSATEVALGLEGVRELRMSRLCATPEFRMFATHLILNASRFAEVYNDAQAAYRRRHHVRTPGRPVPPLAITGAGVELPFWVVRPGQPRRRLHAAVRGDGVELLADAVLICRMAFRDLERAAAHEEPWPIERDGWQLRPRALALSAFARLFLADVFIHGIGGAKYDEMMEDFVRGFFGTEPAPACCVSATVRLPLPHAESRPEDIATARRRSRDLRFNPQRHLHRIPSGLVEQRAGLVRRSQELRARDPHDRAGRRLVFREIRRVNEQMLQTDPWRAAEYDQHVQVLEQRRQEDRIALDREYFYALHPQPVLAELGQAIRRKLGAAAP